MRILGGKNISEIFFLWLLLLVFEHLEVLRDYLLQALCSEITPVGATAIAQW